MSGAETNPPILSPNLTRLFPAGALAAELRGAGDASVLTAAETQRFAKAVPKRVQEFAAGRACAARLLAEFGVSDFPVGIAEDRQPIWPPALIGSITHTEGFCAAVVADKRQVAAIGLDSEVAGRVKHEVWPAIFGASEVQWLRSLPESRRAAAATLIFSAKEAFYKCQYPLVGERLNFHDARIEIGSIDAQGTFLVHADPGIAFARHGRLPFVGRFLFHEEFISTAVALPSA